MAWNWWDKSPTDNRGLVIFIFLHPFGPVGRGGSAGRRSRRKVNKVIFVAQRAKLTGVFADKIKTK